MTDSGQVRPPNQALVVVWAKNTSPRRKAQAEWDVQEPPGSADPGVRGSLKHDRTGGVQEEGDIPVLAFSDTSPGDSESRFSKSRD